MRLRSLEEGPDCPALPEATVSAGQDGQNAISCTSTAVDMNARRISDGPDCPALPDTAVPDVQSASTARRAWKRDEHAFNEDSATTLGPSSATTSSEHINYQAWPGSTGTRKSNLLFPFDPDIIPKYGPLGIRALLFTPSWFSINM